MQLPIYIDGERVGCLRLSRQGNQVRAEARLKDMGRVLRLSVYGRETLYLGIPEPREGGMQLCRMLRRMPATARKSPWRRKNRRKRRRGPGTWSGGAGSPIISDSPLGRGVV